MRSATRRKPHPGWQLPAGQNIGSPACAATLRTATAAAWWCPSRSDLSVARGGSGSLLTHTRRPTTRRPSYCTTLWCRAAKKSRAPSQTSPAIVPTLCEAITLRRRWSGREWARISRVLDREVAPAQRRVYGFGSAATSSSLPSPCGMALHARAPNQYLSIPNHSSPRSSPSPSNCPLVHRSRTWSTRLTEGCAHRQWLLRSIGGIALGQRLAAATARPAIAAPFTPS